MLCLYATGQGAELRYYARRLSVVIKWPIGVCPTTFAEYNNQPSSSGRGRYPGRRYFQLHIPPMAIPLPEAGEGYAAGGVITV